VSETEPRTSDDGRGPIAGDLANVGDVKAQAGRLVRITRNARATIVLAWRAAPVHFGIVLASTIITALITPAQLLLTAAFIDGLTMKPASVSEPIVLYPIVGLTVLALVNRSITVVVERAQQIFSERVHMSARFAFLLHLAGSDIALLEDPAWRDRLQRAGADVSWRPYNMTQTLVWIFSSSITLVTLLSALLFLDPMLLALALLSVVPPIVMRFRVNERLYKLFWTTTRREREHDYLVELAKSTKLAAEVRAFSLGERIVSRARALSENRLQQQRAIYRQANVADFVGGLVSAVVLLVAYAMISDGALSGALTVGEVAAVLGAFASVTAHLGALLGALVSVDQHAQFLDDYFTFLATGRKVLAPAAPKTPGAHIGELALDDVSFTYPGASEPALSGVSFTVKRGETVALVGENGAGKSTLVKLLLRFFDTDRGSVKLDGVDVRDMDPAQVREKVGVLFQDFAQVELEVKEGLHFGRIERPFDDAHAQRALHAARADAVIASIDGGKHGLMSVVGRVLEGGHDLSGGQWQRLALARLIYRDADVWILDEPTANLDPEAEMAVFKELHELTRDKIALIISHRFSTVRTADKIVVLEKGHVLEHGSHDELVKRGGRYAELFDLQARSYR
jgi:ATP-binding cassette subfamily B protein